MTTSKEVRAVTDVARIKAMTEDIEAGWNAGVIAGYEAGRQHPAEVHVKGPHETHLCYCGVEFATVAPLLARIAELEAAPAAEPVPLTLDALTRALRYVAETEPGTLAHADQENGGLGPEYAARSIHEALAALASPDKGEPR